jgi:hypothetical protein
MPLGTGYTVEEQITGQAERGGLQILVYPMRPEIYENEIKTKVLGAYELCCSPPPRCRSEPAMGLAPRGQRRQQIYSDHFGFEAWDRSHSSRYVVHLCNSLVWQSITGHLPPYPPPTAKSYSKAGLPWFDYYQDGVEALPGANTLAELKSVSQIPQAEGDCALIGGRVNGSFSRAHFYFFAAGWRENEGRKRHGRTRSGVVLNLLPCSSYDRNK